MPEGNNRTKFTAEVLALIPVWVAEGKNRDEIAAIIGTTVGSLVVTCSKHQISLAGDHNEEVKFTLPGSVNRALGAQARHMGWSRPDLVAALITAIVESKLYDAVLDLDE